MAEQMKVPVSERALVARINRKLAKQNHRLCKPKEGTSAKSNLGTFYVLYTLENTPTFYPVEDLEEFARTDKIDFPNGFYCENGSQSKALEIGVLKPWEILLSSMADEELIDSGVTVLMGDLGLDKFDTSTKEGKAGFHARLKELQTDMTYTKELQRRMKILLKELKKTEAE